MKDKIKRKQLKPLLVNFLDDERVALAELSGGVVVSVAGRQRKVSETKYVRALARAAAKHSSIRDLVTRELVRQLS